MGVISIYFFLAGLLVCGGGTWLIIRLTDHGGEGAKGLDQPDGLRKKHPGRVSRLGGIAIFGAFIVLVGVSLLLDQVPQLPFLFPIVVGSMMIFGLGLWDDFHPLSARVKLSAQIVIAIVLWFLGLRVDLLTTPTSGEELALTPLLSFGISVFWLVAIPNIVNLADGMDGLAGGLGLFLFLTLGIVGVINPFQHALGILSFGLAGAMIGFLIFNFPPAKIFMGDGGAYFIGFYIAASSLGSSQKSYIGASLIVTLIALGVPILDAIFAFARRWVKGTPITKGDSEHFHHRLLLMGMSSGKALFILYGLFISLSVLALITVFNEGLSIWLSAVFLIVLGLFCLRGLGYVRNFRTIPKDLKRLLRARREVKYAVLISQTLELEVRRYEEAGEFWELFQREMKRIGINPVSSMDGIPIEVEQPFDGVETWHLFDLRQGREQLTREALASCFIAPLYLGIKKFGYPEWSGLEKKS